MLLKFSLPFTLHNALHFIAQRLAFTFNIDFKLKKKNIFVYIKSTLSLLLNKGFRNLNVIHLRNTVYSVCIRNFVKRNIKLSSLSVNGKKKERKFQN